ncbi:MAG: protein kinase [Verrucomicrobiae bacterium]|nr:protein kinase [Verrucomicrobiae bacterium]
MDTTALTDQADAARTPVRRREALVFTDIVGSTRLLSALGDLEGNRRILDHHQLASRVLQRVGGGEIINTGGDSVFLAFPHPRQALRFALRLQHELRAWLAGQPSHLRICDRIGIHYDEVEESRRPDGAKDLTGFGVSLAFSVMDLAGPDQILLSEAAFDLARSAPDEGELDEFAPLSWLSHGHYRLKGLEAPVPIFEVGEEEGAPLQSPGRSPEDRADDDILLGWRPAVREEVPGTPWRVERFLGSSHFGEVWLATDASRQATRALRFCFRPARVRLLREATPLFERLRTPHCQHPGIARLLSFQFDHAPHHLETEYARGQSLWEHYHGPQPTPWRTPEDPLEIMAQAAEALDSAHRAGVVHGNLKPQVVMVEYPPDPAAPPAVKITDFGTGALVAAELAAELAAEFAAELSPDPTATATATGAPLCWAPELFRGTPPSPASDIYALGVLLYQVLVGDLTQPVTIDVARRIRDPLLLDDLLACLATDPHARLRSAGDLAVRLRRLPERRRELARRERRAYWQGVARTAAVAAIIVGLMGWLAWSAMEKQSLATSAQRVAEETAVRLQVANGVRLMENGDLAGSLEQFILALRQESGGPAREQVHRRRIAAVLRSMPRQTQEWRMGEQALLLAIDPSGEWIAGGTEDGAVQVWRIDDGLAAGPTRRLDPPLNTIGFTPDGREFFAHPYGKPLHVWPWNNEGGLPDSNLASPDALAVAASPDGRWYATAGRDAPIHLIQRLDPHAQPVLLPSHPPIQHLAFSRSSRFLAAAIDSTPDHPALLQVWDVPNARLLAQAPPPQSPVRFLEFDPRDALLLVASLREVHLLALPSLEPIGPPRRHDDVVMWAGFAQHGSLFISTSAGRDSRVQVGDTHGAAGLPVVLPHPHSVTGGDLSPDGRYVLTGCFDRHLRLWDPARVALIAEPVRHPAWRNHNHFQIRFLPDGRRAVTVVDDAVRVFDFASHAGPIPPLELEEPLSTWAVSTDGLRLAGAGPSGLAAIWDAVTGARISPRLHHPGPVRQLLFDASGSRLVAIEAPSENASLPHRRIWITDLSRSDPRPRLLGELPRPVRALLASQRDLHVLGEEGDWWIWRLDDPGHQPIRRHLHTPVHGAELSPNHSLLATFWNEGDLRSEVSLWHIDSGLSSTPILEPGHRVRRIAFHSDGTRLLTACTDALLEPRPTVAWDVTTGRRLEPHLWHEDGVLAVACHPSEAYVVTGGEDCLVRLWDPDNPPLRRAEQRMGYQVLDVTFDDSGHLFAATSADGSARVWETHSGQPITPILRHPAIVWRAWFVAGGRRLLTHCNDGKAYLWDLTPVEAAVPDLLQLAHALQGDTDTSPTSPAGPRTDRTHRWSPILEVSPGAVASWHRREAESCARIGRHDLALRHLDLALRALPDHWALHWHRALLLQQLDLPSEASLALAEVLRLDPDCLAAHQRRDQLLSAARPPGDPGSSGSASQLSR